MPARRKKETRTADQLANDGFDRTIEQLEIDGWNVLVKELGIVDAIRYIRIYDKGKGNYTKDRHKWLDKISEEEIFAQSIVENRKLKARLKAQGREHQLVNADSMILKASKKKASTNR